MIEQICEVTQRDIDGVWLKPCTKNACGTCESRGQCSQRLFDKLLPNASTEFFLAGNRDLKTGDRVVLGIHERAVGQASLLVYLLPLLGLILASALATQLQATELQTVTVGLLGFLGTLLGLKLLSSRLHCNPAYHPQLLRKLTVDE